MRRRTEHFSTSRHSHSQPGTSGYAEKPLRPRRSLARKLVGLARWHALQWSGGINWSELAAVSTALVLAAGSAVVFKELQARSGAMGLSVAPAAALVSADPSDQTSDNPIDADEPSSDSLTDTTSPPELADPIAAGLVDPDALDRSMGVGLSPGLDLSIAPSSFDPLSQSPLSGLITPGGVTAGGAQPEPQWDPSTRWFNGRPVKPIRTMTMVVTAYSPDARSCGTSADDITASLHHVQTNGGKLVAADKRVLPLGSMVSVPGYDKGQIVPVLDVGGAIKGNRLDLLFPTHEQARQWGKRTVQVTVWGFADGQGKADWRKIRDSR